MGETQSLVFCYANFARHSLYSNDLVRRKEIVRVCVCVREREREFKRSSHFRIACGLFHMEGTQTFSVKHLLTFISCVVVSVCSHHPALSQSLTGGADCLSQTCGSLTIRYPFKLQSHASCPSFSSFFDLECQGGQIFLHNYTLNDGVASRVRVLEIRNDSLIVDAAGLRAVMGQSNDANCTSGNYTTLELPDFPGPFVIADDNVVATFGCAMSVLAAGDSSSGWVLGGCIGTCSGEATTNTECGDNACCARLQEGHSYRIAVYGVMPSPVGTDSNNSMDCNSRYAILRDMAFSNQSLGLKLKWAIPSNQTLCIANSSSSACSKDSKCTLVPEVPGYLCSCRDGFTGDGYSLGSGCSDVNECTEASLNDCIPHKSTCHNNVEGGYTCKCTSIFHVGDGHKNGSGCSFSRTFTIVLPIICAIVFLGLVTVGLVSFAIYWKRKMKRMYFLSNGGMQLQDLIKKAGGEVNRRLFTEQELIAATENFGEHRKLGVGGFGTVYKGVLADGMLVAIKKANKEGQKGNQDFLNEMGILLQINHRNIVRLLGCCLETVVPLLVYEYAAHGNVRENLDRGEPTFMSWAQRLKVACQTAEALAYLHAAASPPILHRDVKSANVLLDDNFDAKVADFGASRLVPNGVQHVSTAVQGTIGYLDPEYFQTLQLTDKSDVYSLGVVLVELITGQKPVDNQNRGCEYVNLAHLFIHCMQEARGVELIDSCLLDASTLPSNKAFDLAMVQSSIMDVADLAWRCLALCGSNRPVMSHIVHDLQRIAHVLEDFEDELDNGDERTPLMGHKPKISKHHEAGVVLQKADEFIVESSSSSNNVSCFEIDVPTLPR